MKFFTSGLCVACVAWVAGCAGTHPTGTAHYDDYDSVNVEQMVGNNVSGRVFQKVVVCLNARRETRGVTAITNTVVTAMTNQEVHTITNQIVSIATNFLVTIMTNLAPAVPPPPTAVVPPASEVTPVPAETNVTVVVTNLGPSVMTNVTVSLANNVTATIAPNQRTSNNQLVRTLNNQLTTSSNNLSVAVMTNLVVTAETNQVISFLTNMTIVSVTNLIITPTNGVAYDYFLYTELIPPPDFIPLIQGEVLVLLVDGVRIGFSPGQSAAAFVARKGYTSALYHVSPEVLVAIANAKEVRMRIKGVNNVVERQMSPGSRQHFREFVARYFVPGTAPADTVSPGAAAQETTRIANR
jgi:hypothetical protein